MKYDMEDCSANDSTIVALLSGLDKPPKSVMAPEEASLVQWEEHVCFPIPHVENKSKTDRVKAVLEEKIEECRQSGCSSSFSHELSQLLFTFQDVFRLELGSDPPVDMPPLTVSLRESATPVRCKARRYGPEQRRFMQEHVAKLEQAGLVSKNTRSRWCLPPLIVKKPEANEFRMTVDVRAVNAQTERVVWPVPMLEVILDQLDGASVFFSFHFSMGTGSSS